MLFDPEDHLDDYLRVYALSRRVNVTTSSTWVDVVAVSRALQDIGQLRDRIVARNAQIALECNIARLSDWLEVQFTWIPFGATPSIRKSVMAYRQILFDMNEAIHNQDTVPPGNISAFNDQNEAMHNQDTVSPGDMSVFHDRIDAFIKEFKMELAALQSELVRPPEHFSQHPPSSHQRSSLRQRPSLRHRPSFHHCPSSETHMFKGSHHMIITGGTFIQNEGTNLDQHPKLFVLLTKILRVQYVTIIVLFA